MPGAMRSRAGVRRPFSPSRRVVTASVRRHARRERWAIRRPSERTWRCAASASGEVEALGQRPPHLGRDPVARPAGEVLHLVADVEQHQPCRLERRGRGVDEPAGLDRLEHARVAQAALGLLHVGHRGVRELAGDVVALAGQRLELGQPRARLAPPVGEHRGAQPQREARVAREVAYVEEPQRDPQVARGVDDLAHRAHRVVEPAPGVPQRVPERAAELAQVDAVLVDEHHVEVGVGRELAAPVAADRDQGHPGGGPCGGGVRLAAELVGRGGPGLALCCGHACGPERVGAIRARTRPARRCGPARRCRPG